MAFDMNERLNFLKWALCDLIIDLTINAEVLRDALSKKDFSPEYPKDQALVRMVCSSLTVNLSKLSEALSHFGKEVNALDEPLRGRCLAIKKEIEDRKIYQFRSKYAAHLIDKDTNLPLSLVEGEKRVADIFGSTIGELNRFCEWVCPSSGQVDPSSITSVLCELRDYCRGAVGAGARP